MANYHDKKYDKTSVDPEFLGTKGIKIPTGDTAQRVDETGRFRYNSDSGLGEIYTANGWQPIDAPPVVSNISGVINENTDSTITITGSGFKTGAVITIEGNAVGGVARTLTTTVVSSSTLTANTNAGSVSFNGGQSFDIRVTNTSGLSGVLSPAGNVDRDPVWTTGSGTIATWQDKGGSQSTSVSANDPDGTGITYSLTSGSLPGNTSLNTSTGAITTSDPTDVASQTTYTFEITATSNSQSAARSFNIVVNPTADGSSSARAASSAQAIKTLTGTTTDGVYWINLPTVGARQIYCLMNNAYNGGGWMLAMRAGTGTTFSYTSSYWTSNNVLNEGSVSRANGDAKYHSFNYFNGTDIMAIWPDLGNGGCDNVSGGWIWRDNGRLSNESLRNWFGRVNNVYISDPSSFCGHNSGYWSNQSGMRWYGYNYTINNSNRMRWGFAWNNEGDHSSNDTEGGIGSVRAGFSAGDRIYCCQSSNGINRNARVEMYVR